MAVHQHAVRVIRVLKLMYVESSYTTLHQEVPLLNKNRMIKVDIPGVSRK